MFRQLGLGTLTLGLTGIVLASCSSYTADKTATQSVPHASSQSSRGIQVEKPIQSARAEPPTASLDAHSKGKAPGPGPLKEIYFDFDKYDLSADARAVLKANAEWLKSNPSQRIEIEGHSDERGTSEYNLALGAKRAQAAKDYLSSLGISPQRISTISYGEELPTCRQHAEECYQTNRRDRFIVIAGRPAS